MARTLMRVPKMFTADELLEIDRRLPEDLEERRREFWTYVQERVSALGPRLKKIYLASVGVRGQKQLDMLKFRDAEMYEVVQRMIESGGELVEVEDPELVLESLSWMEQLRHALSASSGGEETRIETIGQFLAQSMRERD